ncbi:ATP-binding protein [Dyadobacter sp. CY326]|uniref:PAS domain-containing sensor histidine kinase n=1 Tax=Dyadobacter sp. CY326 TaxID=2907300 RepID=UPI001F1AEC32|nr:ATP-binding protein [Dyadobacter sp. CY326]MCE7067084.1 ATP-binding protein [Dyadobacter sp. CY326]
MEIAEHILQELPCGCVVFDEAGTVTFANRTLGLLLNNPAENIVGQRLEMLLTISSRIFYQTHFFPLLRLKGQANEIFLTLKSESGSPVPVMVNANATTNNGQLSYICVFAPVWERQKYEEQLLETNRRHQQAQQENAMLNELRDELELNQFELDRKISILREHSQEYLQMGKVFMHDMQEPIRKISLFFDKLKSKGKFANADDEMHLAVINKSILRLRFLTGSLLDFVQISKAADPVTMLNANELLVQARNQVIRDGYSPEINLVTGNLPEFEGRASQFRRLFVELFKNAIENKHPDRELTIQVTGVAIEENAYQNHLSKYKYIDHIKIEFADNGIGFDDQFNEYIFGLLNKLNADTNGSGLGLALCKQILSLHYGKIKAKSVIGQGTTIVIVVPLHQTALQG